LATFGEDNSEPDRGAQQEHVGQNRDLRKEIIRGAKLLEAARPGLGDLEILFCAADFVSLDGDGVAIGSVFGAEGTLFPGKVPVGARGLGFGVGFLGEKFPVV